MSELCETALKTIERLKTIYFKIEPNGSDWKIKQYVGPAKMPITMAREGWNRHLYLTKYITNDYPIFDLADFTTKNGIAIEKKSAEDLLKEELNKYIEMLSINSRSCLRYKRLKVVCPRRFSKLS